MRSYLLVTVFASAVIGGPPSKVKPSRKTGLRRARATTRKLGEADASPDFVTDQVANIMRSNPLNMLLQASQGGIWNLDAIKQATNKATSGIPGGNLLFAPTDMLTNLLGQNAITQNIPVSQNNNKHTDAASIPQIPQSLLGFMDKAKEYADTQIDTWSNTVKGGKSVVGQWMDTMNWPKDSMNGIQAAVTGFMPPAIAKIPQAIASAAEQVVTSENAVDHESADVATIDSAGISI